MAKKKNANVIFFTCSVVFPLLLMLGCAKKAPEPAERVTELEGAWIGSPVSPVDSPQESWIFIVSKNRAIAALPTGWLRGTFQLDTVASPKQIDIIIQQCYPQDYVGKTVLAIYKLDGNTLTLAGFEPGVTTRPTSFQKEEGIAIVVFTKQ